MPMRPLFLATLEGTRLATLGGVIVGTEAGQATVDKVRMTLYPKYIGVGVFLVAASLAFGTLWWIESHDVLDTATTYSEDRTTNSVLESENEPFAAAQQLARRSSADTIDQRAELYRQAMRHATDATQEGHIQYKLANTYIQKRDFSTAILIFENIATTTAYSRFDRAYAIKMLGSMFYNYHDPDIKNLTFAAEPFASMAVAGDDLLTYRHLFEYCSSVYPLGYCEGRIADWYANQLVLFHADSTAASPQAASQYARLIQEKLVNIDRDIARIKTDSNASADIPELLLRKAIILGKLAEIRQFDDKKAEQAFLDAQQLNLVTFATSSPFIAYHYADFVNRVWGSTRAADIQNILSVIYDSPIDLNAPVMFFLRNERNNVTGTKPAIAHLATVDPRFKTFLESTLAWQESDFE